jgi:membrane protein implicated in regulation of membrane protease activity
MIKLPNKAFHLIFSLVMGAIMVFLMTCVITLANIGMPADFLSHWQHSFLIAYPVAVPVIYLFAPISRKITARLVEHP